MSDSIYQKLNEETKGFTKLYAYNIVRLKFKQTIKNLNVSNKVSIKIN